jgi:ferric-dicitrate binding protein FerR (iron transport regulator)
MTTRTKLLSSAAKALGEAADRTPAQPPTRDARARAISAVETALRARAAQKRRRAWLGRFSVAAAVLLGAIGGERLLAARHDASLAMVAVASSAGAAHDGVIAIGRNLAGSASAFRAGKPVPFDGAQLASGDRVVTAVDAHAEIALSTGTSVVLAPAADVTFAREGRAQTFGLDRGAVRARVAKLHEGERFVVHTNDTEVEVRGTVFEVSLVPADPSCGDGTPTRVRVTEGVVVVRHHGVETRVPAGEAWPSGCAAKTVPPTASAASATATTSPSVVAPPTSSATTTTAVVALAPTTTSAPAPAVKDGLAAQNDLFSSALAAKRRGDLRTALSGFDAYLAHYPGGGLAENAAAQRMSILATLEPAKAKGAARDYLARWPQGFAREQARTLVGEEKPASP